MKTKENNMPEKIIISFESKESKTEFEGLIKQIMFEQGYWQTSRIYNFTDKIKELLFEKSD